MVYHRETGDKIAVMERSTFSRRAFLTFEHIILALRKWHIWASKMPYLGTMNVMPETQG